MKVLRVIPSMNPTNGGPCQGIRNSIPELEKLGVSNEVVSLDDPSAPFLAKDAFIIHALGAGKGPWCYNKNLIPWLVKNLSRFDVIVVHGLWLFHGYAVRKAIQQIQKGLFAQRKEFTPKLFIMPHGMLDPYFQRASGRKLKALRNWIYWKLLEGKLINNATGILFTCEAELLLAREPFRPYTPKKELNVGYGIYEPPVYDTSMRTAFEDKCPEVCNRPFLLFLSRIHEKKGVAFLIEAYNKVFGDGTEYRVSDSKVLSDSQSAENKILPQPPLLVIAGPGMETSYGQHLKQVVSSSKEMKDSVFFPGMLTGDAKWGAFYACDAFILPSHQENFGIALVEAMACGKPVLISNQVNIWKEIHSFNAGIVDDDTVRGTQKLIENWNRCTTEKKISMGKQARTCFEKRFSLRPAVSRLLEAFT